jgi:hypothetical protein
MTKKTINLGNENAGNGDPLRIAFAKVNDNFNELYALTGGPGADLSELLQDSVATLITNGSHQGVTASYDDNNNVLNFTINIDGGTASTTF